MKIDCDVLNGKNPKGLFSDREALAFAKAVPLGDQELILSGLFSYDVTTSLLTKP